MQALHAFACLHNLFPYDDDKFAKFAISLAGIAVRLNVHGGWREKAHKMRTHRAWLLPCLFINLKALHSFIPYFCSPFY